MPLDSVHRLDIEPLRLVTGIFLKWTTYVALEDGRFRSI